MSSRAAQTARDLSIAISAAAKHQAFDDVLARCFAEAIERLRGPSPSPRLGMTSHFVSIHLVPRRLAVLPAFAGADINALAVVHLHLDRLVTAVTTEVEADVVALFL